MITEIKNDIDLIEALEEILEYFINEPVRGSIEAARFVELANMIEEYENIHFAIE